MKPAILESLFFGMILTSSLIGSLANAHSLDALDGNYHGYDQDLVVQASATWSGSDVTIQLTNNTKYTLTEYRHNNASITGIGNGVAQLSSDGATCFNNTDSTIRFCGDANSILLETRDANGKILNRLNLTSDQNPSVAEAPRTYSLDELRTRAINHSFESQVEFEHAFQARQMAKVSRLNMLPHLSLGSVIGVALMDKISLYNSIGDLVPFLLPTRWLQIKENSQRSQAEADALVLVKSDAGFMVEGLTLSILRDQETLQKLQTSLVRITAVRDELAFRENLGEFQPGVHDDVTSLVIQIQKTIETMTEGVQEEYAALAQASGFADQTSIAGITPLTTDQLIQPAPVHDDLNIQPMLDQSYELKQIDHLVLAARASRNESWFSWMDPAGDPNGGGLGFALPAYVSLGTSHIRELEVRHSQMESILTQKLHTLTEQANLASSLFTTSTEDLDVQQNRVDRMLTNISVGASFALSDLINALQDQVRNDIDLTSAQYTFLMSKAALNRLEMTGPYAP